MALRILFLLSLICLLSGCGLITSNQPTTEIEVQAARYLNPDVHGKTSPVLMSIYQLKSQTKFSKLTYHQLMAQDALKLGQDLNDKQVIEIQPGKYRTLILPLADDTRFIGIIAAYRNIDQAAWRVVTPYNPKVSIQVELQTLGVHLTTKPKRFLGIWS